MKITAHTFRLTLTVSWVLVLAGAAVDISIMHRDGALQQQEETRLNNRLYFVLTLIVVTGVIASYIGLYKFRKWGRTLWLGMGLLGKR